MELRINLSKNGIRLNPRIAAAIGLITLSLIAAVAISASANRSVYIWAAKSQIAAGSAITVDDINKVKVFLPENSKLYFSTSAKLIGLSALRTIGSGELIPASAISSEISGIGRESVPIRVSKNDFPSDLAKGANIDIYSLPARETSAKSAAYQIAHKVIVESIDNRSREISGEIGIVVKLKTEEVENFLTETINSKLVVVRNAF